MVFKKKRPIKNFVLGLLRTFGVLLVLGLGFTGAWWGAQQDALVVPEAMVDKWFRVAQDLGNQYGSSPVDVSVERVPREFTDLLERLRERHGTEWDGLGAARGMEEAMRGRTLLLRSGAKDLLRARESLERAILMEPRLVLALTGLAEVYARLGATSKAGAEESVRVLPLLNQADRLGGYPVERLRSRAAWLIYGGKGASAKPIVQEALLEAPEDAHLHFLKGLASVEDEDAGAGASAAFRASLEYEPEAERVLLALGEVQEALGAYRPAAESYRLELSRSSVSHLVHRKLGLLLEDVGKFEDAAEHYRRSVALNALQPELALRRAVIVHQVEKRPQRARGLLRKILAGEHGPLTAPLAVRVKLHLSAAVLASGNSSSAGQLAKEVLSEESDHPAALFHLGMAQLASGDVAKGEGTLLNVDGSRFSALERARIQLHAGVAALRRGRGADAAIAFDRALDAAPAYIPATLWALVPRLGDGDQEGRLREVTDFVGQDPLAWSRARVLTEIYAPEPSFGELLKIIDGAAQRAPEGPQLWLLKGVTNFYAGNMQEAEVLLAKVQGKDVRNRGVQVYAGLIELGRGRRERAAKHFGHLLELSHNRGAFHALHGENLREQGSLKDAAAAFERAGAYGDDSAWTLTQEAMVAAALNQTDRARALLEEAEAREPDLLEPRLRRYELGL